MQPLRFAVFGAGFWTRYQLSAWREVGGVECVGIYNRTRARADALAEEFEIPAVFDDPEALLAEARPDFVDNITEIGGHVPLSLLCARHHTPCICQKPMAPSRLEARRLVEAFSAARTPFFVHENWRWQTPMRALIRTLRSGVVGVPFRARLSMVSGFAPWVNQPLLAQLEQFVLMDVGSHLLDTARACFGEASSLYCQVHRTQPDRIRGENVATILLAMGPARTTVLIELGYAETPLERECFPQTLAFVEGPLGSIEITPDFGLRVTTSAGTQVDRVAPPRYSWADPRYDIAHAAIAECHRDLLPAIRGDASGETTGADNLRTMELVFAAYDSARTGSAIGFTP